MYRLLFILGLGVLFISSCEILGNTDIRVRAEDLQIVTDSTNYVGRRRDPKSVLISVDATYINKSKARIYLSGCGTVLEKFEQLVDGQWVHREGGAFGCPRIQHESVVVEPGESKPIHFSVGTWGAEYPDQSWGRQDISGTFRIKVSAFLHWDYQAQHYSTPVPETGLYSNSFEVEDRCVISWGGC